MVEGNNSPVFVTAEKANLPDSTPIIAVVVEGQAKAYPLSRLTAIVDHVVNDQVTAEDGKTNPFTVTYCDKTDCVRVFSASDDSMTQPMNVSTIGLLDGGLALRWNGVDFKQMDKISGFGRYPLSADHLGTMEDRTPPSRSFTKVATALTCPH